jgi:hypothetical protein
MAIELEISDGSPWYLSPDIWVVADPSDTNESTPIAGVPCYLMAKVHNNGSSGATNATVRFYWANPAIGVSRSTATLVGQAFVTLAANDVQDVLCLTPWVPEFLNEGHECVLAEAFHTGDPLPASTDFNVPTDRHVAQRNLSVVLAIKKMFHMNFEMHNGQRTERNFAPRITQVAAEKILKKFPRLKKMYDLGDKKEGKLVHAAFTNTRCPDNNTKDAPNKKDSFELPGFGKKQMAVTGEIEGDFAFVVVSQHEGKTETGGLGILIINQKN